MNIALVARGCHPGAGIERYTFELAKRLALRHHVSVLTNPATYVATGATLVPIKAPGTPHWLSVLRFSELAGQRAKQGHYDIVHTQGSDGNWGDVVTAHSSHLAGMRASLKVNPGCINQLKKKVSPAHHSVLRHEKQALFSSKKILAVSKRVAWQLRAAYPDLNNQIIEVVYPGTTLPDDEVTRLGGQRKLIRSRCAVNDQQVLFVMVAKDPVLKGAKRIIQALSYCKEKNHLLIIAPLSQHERLKAMARQEQVASHVHLLAMDQDATAAYCAADVYLGLPEYESFGLTYLEAMALGKPVLLPGRAGVAELTRTLGGGVVVPLLSTSKTIAEAMDQLAKDEPWRQQLGKQARAIAEKYQWDGMVKKIERVYDEIRSAKHEHKKNTY